MGTKKNSRRKKKKKRKMKKKKHRLNIKKNLHKKERMLN